MFLRKIDNLIKPVFYIGFFLLFAIVLIPYAKNGFWTDDAFNSQIWGMVHRFDTSVWDFSFRVTQAWFEGGRILFLWPVIYGFFYALQDELALRLANMALFIAHIGVTVYLLRRIGISWRALGVFVLTLIAMLQIRDSSDPLAGFAGTAQVLGILLTISLLLLVKWYETKAAGWLFASSLLATLSMMCYEINLVYMPIAIVTVLASRNRSMLRNLAILILPFAVFIAITIYIRIHALSQYNGSTVGNFGAIPETFLKQLIATVPGSSYFLLGRYIYPLPELMKAAVTSKLAWIVMLLWSAMAVMVLRRESEQKPTHLLASFAALMLLLVPPVLISVSARYQSELIWGKAHLPIYYQYFGMAFLVATVIDRLSTGIMAKLVMVCVPVVGLYVALTWTMNMHLSAIFDSQLREPRDSLELALQEGLFSDVRDGDVVQIEGQPLYINGNLIYQEIGKNVSIPNEAVIVPWFESLPRQDARFYRLFRDPASNNRWTIVEQ